MTQILTGSKARSFAETTWGRGGTKAYRTNRLGAYYYSCSAHGGYVVDGMALTEAERAEIDKYIKPQRVLVVTYDNGRKTFIQNPYSWRSQRYVITGGTKHEGYPIYFFEEDCAWTILEKFTDIRAAGKKDNPVERDRVFNQWCKPI